MLRTLLIAAGIIALTAIPTWILQRYARNYPPAYTRAGEPSGFGGFLTVIVMVLALTVLVRAAEVSYMSAELFFMVERSREMLVHSAMAVLPLVVSLFLNAFIIYMLVCKRTPSAIGASIVMYWVSGLGMPLLQSQYFHMPLTNETLARCVLMVVVFSLYLALSRRAALTYGTKRGERIFRTGKP